MPKVKIGGEPEGTTEEEQVKIDEATDAALETQNANASLTGGASSDTQVQPEGVRIHMDRPIGGRYISLGGGERVWVPEEGVEADKLEAGDPRIDDAELVKRQNPQAEEAASE